MDNFHEPPEEAGLDARAWTVLKLLGSITGDGETFYLPCKDNFTSNLTVRLLDAFQTEFGEKLCVVLDNAPYFAAKKVHEFADGTLLELSYLLPDLPELNSAEECWHQLSQRLGNQLFEELDELRDVVLAALDSIGSPNVSPYLCL
ncbi:hypothetical protein C448_05468 [Halococcus morrhuae DSM 1307]|uniref:Tc1-like transposase DDE domain-containing protein n=1 Tax=Halococcus morrhuae DSM 1307 TaxID=931277 RepID=M0MS77_HALMO|nr:hypothetical protein C448_05468 [Halococcus morrhuae DSM 1307]